MNRNIEVNQGFSPIGRQTTHPQGKGRRTNENMKPIKKHRAGLWKNDRGGVVVEDIGDEKNRRENT